MHVYPNYYKKFHNYIKKFSSLKYKKTFVLSNIRMKNLSLHVLRLIAQIRTISDYENKSQEDLIKAISEAKPKPETPEPETKPKQIPKPQTPKPEIPKPKPKP